MAASAKRDAFSRRPTEIYEHLRQRIERGDFKLDMPFPTEKQLCAEEGVSRYALREAMGMLEAEGLINRRRGAGTRLISRTPTSVFRHATGSRAELLNYVSGTRVDWRQVPLLRTDGALARLLGCDEMRQWQFLTGTRIDADGEPVALVSVYVDPQRALIAEDTDFGDGPIYEWLENHRNLRVATMSQDIRAISLSAAQAETLNDTPGASVLQMIRRYFDAANTLYLISVTTHRSRDFVYNLRVQLKD